MSFLLEELRTTINLYSSWLSVKENVKTNGSKQSRAEIDRIHKNVPAYIKELQAQLKRGYKFDLPDGRLKKRAGKKPRPIVVAPIKDRIVQRAILDILQSDESTITSKLGNIPDILSIPTSVGGIPKKGIHDAMLLIKISIAKGAKFFITSDIKEFFTKIPRESVIEYILSETKDAEFSDFFRSALATEIANKDEIGIKEFSFLFLNEHTGVAQGSSLSAFAGNILLHNLDKKLNCRGITMIRYIDDFVILGESEKKIKAAFQATQKILDDLGMSAYAFGEDNTKYKQGMIVDGFNFLGCTITPTIITPSIESQQNILNKIKKTISQSKEVINKFKNDNIARGSEKTLIQSLAILDRQIKGWGDAFAFCDNNHSFNKLDKAFDAIILNYLYQQIRELQNINSDSKRRMLGIALLKDRKFEQRRA